MKKILPIIGFLITTILSAQQPVIIDHQCMPLSNIPMEWVQAAKADLFIAYGHTSHGSQLTSGMNALEAYYKDGTYDWSHSGGAGELHLFEGAGYGTGYLQLDCGYAGWDDETREYLDDHPDCNVMMWSWCGQVNNVDLTTHYLQPMEQLESEYPDVQFVYMTGHLEGLGPDGSLFLANEQIRDYCMQHNKILFDFADIEKFSPDADTNYQAYFADDGCNYQPPAGGTANWAHNWLNNNPGNELTVISDLCGSCAHSVNLNCVKKGIACWYMWARLAGWDGQVSGFVNPPFDQIKIYPLPFTDQINIVIEREHTGLQITMIDLAGQEKYQSYYGNVTGILPIQLPQLASGVYMLRLETAKLHAVYKVIRL